MKVENDTDSSDNEYLYTMSNEKAPKVNVKICHHAFKATVILAQVSTYRSKYVRKNERCEATENQH